jgi:hypothetical protein
MFDSKDLAPGWYWARFDSWWEPALLTDDAYWMRAAYGPDEPIEVGEQLIHGM